MPVVIPDTDGQDSETIDDDSPLESDNNTQHDQDTLPLAEDSDSQVGGDTLPPFDGVGDSLPAGCPSDSQVDKVLDN